ncbi:MAG TPA: YicC/YloC family endoribonuclease [Planctomycetaceae bacterium]|nr:YicC/YloC family endoribonuclease [Planctomycetaceae bacterium]
MLLSMTGFGEARAVVDGLHLSAELRSVNNRHFKLTLRSPDLLAPLEGDLERVLRETITRGTVSLFLRIDRGVDAASARLNVDVLAAYWKQLRDAAQKCGAPSPQSLSEVLSLPGVVDDGRGADADLAVIGPAVEKLVREALEHFQQFRVKEGAAMAAELHRHLQIIIGEVDRIALLAPQVVAEYRDRLFLRIQEVLQKAEVTLTPSDLLREVALFTDRSDISEEIVRLRSHLDQFQQMLKASTSQGRKLEFLCQELFREANTIGSKSNHVGVAHAAVEIKSAIERIREVVLNLE